jgi:hypothetical protein
MNPSLLEDMGLRVRDTGAGVEAELELDSVLVNPLTRKPLTKVLFTVMEERLLVIDPPELVGTPPLSLARIETHADLEQAIAAGFNEHILHVQRRSGDLQALGLSPRVEPETLQLTAEVVAGSFRCVVATDKRGNFRVARAFRGDHELNTSGMQAFELSEFREKGALAGYLQALFAEPQAQPQEAPAASEAPVSFGEISARFGTNALLPPKSSLEILVEISVDGARYRFAAARVNGRSFRGLLAGSRGKVWAERFELDQFPGVERLVSQLLNVSAEAVKVLAWR